MRSVIRAAFRDRFMARDVTVGIRLPGVRKASAAMAIPTAQEVGAAIRATDDVERWYAAFIAVCAFAGLRPRRSLRDRTRKAAAGLVDQAFGSTADALRTERRT